MKPEYNTKYGESCDCPYCGETQDVDIDGHDAWNEEIECDDCGGLFRYSLEITHEFTCEPIAGEGLNRNLQFIPYQPIAAQIGSANRLFPAFPLSLSLSPMAVAV